MAWKNKPWSAIVTFGCAELVVFGFAATVLVALAQFSAESETIEAVLIALALLAPQVTILMLSSVFGFLGAASANWPIGSGRRLAAAGVLSGLLGVSGLVALGQTQLFQLGIGLMPVGLAIIGIGGFGCGLVGSWIALRFGS